MGGANLGDAHKRIARSLYTDEVAVLFNWEGKKNKRKFSELIISRVIMGITSLKGK